MKQSPLLVCLISQSLIPFDVVGDIYLFIQDVPTEDIYERYGELNVSIADKSCRQQGLAKEAVASIILWAYRELELCRFFVKINEENSASISLFKKLGFQVVNTNTVFHELELRISLNEELKQKLLDIVQ